MRHILLKRISFVRKLTTSAFKLPPLPEGVFFDWDGTILAFRESKFLWCFNQTLDELGYPKSMHMTSMKGSKSIYDSFYSRIDTIDGIDKAYSRFKKMFASLQVTQDELMPGAQSLCDQLNSCQIPVGIISNLDQYLLEKQINELGLQSSFKVVIGSAQKPSTAGLTRATKSLRLPVSKSLWYLGDSLSTDILAANKAGFTSILVNESASLLDLPGSENIKPDVRYNNMNEVISILDTLKQTRRSL
jgi:phosphoglycolate phosphatase-like HAD superfamily hydrolase